LQASSSNARSSCSAARYENGQRRSKKSSAVVQPSGAAAALHGSLHRRRRASARVKSLIRSPILVAVPSRRHLRGRLLLAGTNAGAAANLRRLGSEPHRRRAARNLPLRRQEDYSGSGLIPSPAAEVTNHPPRPPAQAPPLRP